jgi:two-component system, cell cycle response regulator CtrA
MRVLLIERDLAAGKSLNAFLIAQGLATEVTDIGEEALELLRHYDFDMVVLTLALRDMEGSAFIRRMRLAGRTMPVLALSSSLNPRSRVQAFAAGADDVVDHAIDRAELVARIHAIARRSRGHSQASLQVGAVGLDLERHEVVANGSVIPLTGKEYQLLRLLMLRKNMVLTKETILQQLYGGMDEPEIKIIDVFVCKIRKKLAKVGLDDFVGTVWGRGYTVRDQSGGRADPTTPTMPMPTGAPRHPIFA